MKNNFKVKYGFDLNCSFCRKEAETLQHILQFHCVPFVKHKTGISVNVLLQQRHDTETLNPPGTKGFGTHTKHQGGGVEKDPPPSISRTRNATNLKPLEGLGVSFKVSKNFKLV